MSGVGFSELLVLFLIGLIVLGPEKLPRVANQLGTWLGQARRMSRVLKRQLEDELDLDQKRSAARAASASKPAFVTPVNDTDDTFSPDHGPDEPGSGVGDRHIEDSIAPAGSNDDDKNLDQDISSAMPAAGTNKTDIPAAETRKKEKIS
jgi:sec-independent protein translocase protein TatB